MNRIAVSVLIVALCTLWTVEFVSAQDPAAAAQQPADAAAQAAQDKTAAEETATKESPEKTTHKVEAEPLKVEVNLTGTFEASQMAPVAIHPEAWSAFSVTKAVPHGTKVSKGDQLVWLDMHPIEKQLADMQQTLKIGQLDQDLAELELQQQEKTLPMDLELARRSKKQMDEDLLYFLKTGRPHQEKSAKFSLESAENSLEYAQEELEQLEKMYKADDLTEESEEIVLERARNDVKRAKFLLESTELRTERTLEQELPREQKTVEDAAKRRELALARSEVTLPAGLSKKQIEVEKQKVAHQRSVEKYKELENDRDLMIIRAPMDGYVYYGPCKRGKFGGIESAQSQLKQGGKLTPHSVFMTVVALRPMTIRVDVPEKELHQVETGLTGTAVATAMPEQKLKTEVTNVSMLPIGSGNHDGQLDVEIPEDATMIVPGMSCKVTLVVCDKQDALTVPAAAVFVDQTDDQRDLVYLVGDDGEATEQKVVIGQKTEKKWEIVEGLEAGDEIMLKKPEVQEEQEAP